MQTNRKQVRQETAEQKTGHARCNRTEGRSCKRQQNRRKIMQGADSRQVKFVQNRKQVMQTSATQKTVKTGHECRKSRKQDRSCKGQQNTATQKAGHAGTGEHEAGGNLMVEQYAGRAGDNRTEGRSCLHETGEPQGM